MTELSESDSLALLNGVRVMAEYCAATRQRTVHITIRNEVGQVRFMAVGVMGEDEIEKVSQKLGITHAPLLNLDLN